MISTFIPEQPLLTEWADRLSAVVGRTQADLLAHGLQPGDLDQHDEVVMLFADGSSMHFRYALCLRSPHEIVVFSLHCGSYSFAADTVRVITSRHRSSHLLI